MPIYLDPVGTDITPSRGPINVIRYVGEGYIPQDIKRRRKQNLESMRRMGTPVIIKHMFNAEDVEKGVAETSPNFSHAYGQVRHDDPISHGVGYVSVEKSNVEWVSPTGDLVVAPTSPGAGYTPAPRYRGFGPGYLTYIVEPDVAEDVFKLTDTGVLIQVQSQTVQAPWYPEMNDNDLCIRVTLDRYENVTDTQERFQLKMVNPITMRGLDRRGKREYTEDGGNRFVIEQDFEMTLVPPNDVLYNVETDR